MKNRFSLVCMPVFFALLLITFQKQSFAGNCFGCCAVVANGTLTLTAPLTIKNNKDKVAKISSGIYEAHFKLTDSDQVIAIEIMRAAGFDQVLEMRLPEGVIAQGEFFLKGPQIGQDFDVLGEITKNTVRSPTYTRNSSCTRTETIWLPRPVQVVRYGTQRVVYHNLETTHYNRLQFLVNSVLVGVLEASRQSTHQVIEDTGPCY